MTCARFLSRVPDRRNAGFALIAVLFGLAVIALLLAAATDRNVGSATGATVEQTLARRLILRETLSEVAIALGASELLGEGVYVPLEEANMRIWAEDVSGRIDLNTAAPILLESLLDGFDAPPGGTAAYAALRRQRMFRGAFDFAVEMRIDPDHWGDLVRSVTIHSGRPGISPEWVRTPLLPVLERAGLMKESEDTHISSPSNEIYVVLADTGTGIFEVGTMQLGGSLRNRRVLSLGMD